MTLFETVTLAISAGQLLVAGLGVWLVRQGLQQMRRAGDQREKREDARHREAMAAIDSRHREAMHALDGQVEAFRSQGEALRSLAVVGLPKKGAVPGRTAPFSLATYGQETEQLFPFVLSVAKRSRRTLSTADYATDLA